MYTYLSTSCMTQYAIKFTKVRDMILRVYAFGKRIQLKIVYLEVGRRKRYISELLLQNTFTNLVFIVLQFDLFY